MDLSHLAQSGTVIAVRVTPAARRNEVAQGAHGLRIWVTAAPENGKATKAVRTSRLGPICWMRSTMPDAAT